MTFSNSLRSPREEPLVPPPLRPIGVRLQSQAPNSTASERANVPRRFTTNAVPTLNSLSSNTPLSPIGQQRRQAAESMDLSSAHAFHQVQLVQRKKEQYEFLLQQQERFQSEMANLDFRAKNTEDELQRLQNELNQLNTAGHQSEPTTPPEYHQNGFTRPNRLSLVSLTSPPSITSMAGPRSNRSSTQAVTSPFQPSTSQLPSLSVPGTRRNSDEDEDQYEKEIQHVNNSTRRPPGLNRISMPVTNFDLRGLSDLPDVASVLGTGLNSILNDSDDEKHLPSHAHSKSIDGKSFLHMDTTSEQFPILIRRDGETSLQPSASTSTLGASQQTSGAESDGWPSFNRHRPGQQSLPMNTLRTPGDEKTGVGGNEIFETPTKAAAKNRHSMEVKFSSPFGETMSKPKRSSLLLTPPNGLANGMAPKLQHAFSANDIPKVPTAKSASNGINNHSVTPLTHAEPRLQNQSATIGRIPQSATNRHSRDFSTADLRVEEPKIPVMPSVLQGSAPPFGPLTTTAPAITAATTAAQLPTITSPYSPQPFYGGYGMSMLTNGMNNMSISGAQGPWGTQMSMYPGFSPYGQFPQYAPARLNPPDSQSRVIAQRRQQNAEENARFNNFKWDQVIGRIADLCKDQHGCRFLQKEVEKRDPHTIELIFLETKDHFVELMTDPFGNYLCQKLLEFTNQEQRTELINIAATDLVRIALNQHGTRALQKMIEYVDTPEQIEIIIRAFDGEVVTLIQDLNGNHVIQKCLNHLKPEEAQFIFDAVGQCCLIVGTHRHGCCVLQRCIDHATGSQKANLVAYITQNACSLVQDPFGNYVVQYILDLNIAEFTRPLCMQFKGKVVLLSKQKFSSNVIEKCIRVADDETRQILVEELIMPHGHDMERILRDNFANYVVQTAIDHCDRATQDRFWEIIAPILPNIKSTPCGRRLMSKLSQRPGRQEFGQQEGMVSGQITPQEFAFNPNRLSGGQFPAYNVPVTGYNPFSTYPTTIASPTPHRLSQPTFPLNLQNAVNSFIGPYSQPRPAPASTPTMNFF